MKKNLLLLILHSSFLIFHSSLLAQWSELGGMNSLNGYGWIESVCSDASGNIYVGGKVTSYSEGFYGGFNVAKWDGSAWSEPGGENGLSADWGTINSVCSDASGNIYAGGYRTSPQNPNIPLVAKWDGTTWSELGGKNGFGPSGSVNSICSDASGNIYAVGWFTNSLGNSYVAKWDGTVWSELGGKNGLAVDSYFSIHGVCSDASGNIYAGGYIAVDSSLHSNFPLIAKWDGTAWSELGGLNELTELPDNSGSFNSLSLCSDASGNIYAGGSFKNSLGKSFVAKWDGTVWSELGGLNGLAANADINSICSDASGNIYVGGNFTYITYKRNVAKWDGTVWSELGGLNGGLAANGDIFSVCNDPSGNIYAVGSFYYGGQGNTYVAKYNVITGTENVSGDAWEMNIFPNPARNEIHINQNNLSGKKTMFFTLVNLQGRIVLEQPYESSKPIDVSTLPEGLYMATLKGKAREVSGKVVIKR